MSAGGDYDAGHGPILPGPGHHAIPRNPVPPADLEAGDAVPNNQPYSPQVPRASGEKPRRNRRSHQPVRSVRRDGRMPGREAIHYRAGDIKKHFVAMAGEFVGTTLFLLFAFAGTQVANTVERQGANPSSQLLYISASFGFSLLIAVWIFFRISGGLFNPAVTFGLVISGALPPLRGALLLVPQFLAGMVAAAISSAMLPGPSLVQTSLSNGTSTAQGFWIETFATFLLVITVLMLAAEKSKATFIAPVGIGLALFVAELGTVNFTGGSLNPTRSFGPCVVARQFPGYHWIYWIGPLLGSGLASGFYWFVKSLKYEEANPGQDASDDEGE